jgi:thiamine-monophosphate kinase
MEPSEKWLIESLQKRFGVLADKRTVDGIRISTSMSDLDDCCALDINDATRLVIGTDYIRGREFLLFRLGFLNYFDIGYYLVAANLSDIASMGALPVGITLTLRYPKDMDRKQCEELIDGIATACERFGNCSLLGGDSGGATDLVLSVTAIGRTNNILLRSSARPGDKVYLIGSPGLAGVIYELGQKNLLTELSKTCPNEVERLLSTWRRPKPLIEEGLALSGTNERISCQDTSDGLKAALQQIAGSSNNHIIIKESLLQPHSLLRWSSEKLGKDVLSLFFGSSVDFCLVFTAPPYLDLEPYLSGKSGQLLQAKQIGVVKEGAADISLEVISGELLEIPGKDYLQ